MQFSDNTSTSGFVYEEDHFTTARFTDCEEIPSQGFKCIVKAKRHGRWWILKGLQPTLRDSETQRRMLREEYDTLAALQHSGIAQAVAFESVEDFGDCIVMEWIDGTTLKEWLGAPHRRKERRRVAHQLTETLRYVHSRSTAHRDLKPSNVLITRSGTRVKLIDFAAPSADAFDDIYSLGCVFEDLRLGLAYAPIVRKCKAKSRNRYKSIEQVQRAIRRLQTLKHLCGIFCLLALFAGALTFSLNRTPPTDKHIYAVADSLRGEIEQYEERIDSSQSVIAEMETIFKAAQKEVERREEKDRAIRSWLAGQKSQMKAIIQCAPDTMTQQEAQGVYYKLSFQIADLKEANPVPKSRLGLTDAEVINVARVLSYYSLVILEPLNAKMDNRESYLTSFAKPEAKSRKTSE